MQGTRRGEASHNSTRKSGGELARGLVLLGVTVGLGGCPIIDDLIGETTSAEGGEEKGDGDDPVEASYDQPCPPAAPLPSDALCDPARQVVELPPGSTCGGAAEEAAGWTGAALPMTTAGGAVLCAYTPKPSTKVTKEAVAKLEGVLKKRLGPKGTVRMGPDCRVSPVANPPAAAGSYGSAIAPVLEASFARAIGMPDPSKVASAVPGGTPKVAVYVVDTAGRDRSQARANHGKIVASIVEAVVDGSDGAVVVHTVAGMPRWDDGQGVVADPQGGGYFGYQSDLAAGIREAVDRWKASERGQGVKLVINLSAGWEPVVDGAPGQGSPIADPLSPAAASVHEAIAYARCHGGLVFAASGNQPSGTCVDQTMGPAMFAQLPTPDSAMCAQLMGEDSPVQGQAMLYAVTPLDLGGQPLMSHRPGSHAWLAATGFQGIVEGTRSHGPQNGSSIATAVASGAVALAWASKPSMRGDAVVEAVYAAGGSSPHAPDISPPAVPGTQVYAGGQKVVDVCEGLEAVSGSPLGCAAATWDNAAWCSDLRAAMGPAAADGATHDAPASAPFECEACGEALTRYLPRFQPQQDPSQLPEAWTFPQPEDTPCPPCDVETTGPGTVNGGKAHITLSAVFTTGYTVDSLTITLVDGDGTRHQHTYWGSQFTPGLEDGRLHVLDDAAFSKDAVSGWIDFRFTDTTTQRSFTTGNELRVIR